ncbi:MAG: enoyl-CoA hydratase [Gammaproteobacteria bacterium]
MNDDNIRIHCDSGVQTIQINRVEKKIALTLGMYRSMSTALRAGEADEQIRAHILLGAPDIFTAGNDIHDFLNGMLDGSTSETPPVLDFLHSLATLTKPIVAGVDGPAIGIGTTLLLHCDLVVLGETARLKVPFVDLGLCPEAASSWLMPQYFGHQRAAELLLLGGEIDAHTALSWGLANRVVSPERVTETAQDLANTLAKKPANALRLSKQLMKNKQTKPILDCMNHETTQFMAQLATDETRQVLAAFFKH